MDAANSVDSAISGSEQPKLGLEQQPATKVLKKIWIEVDSAAAFDIISILEVKEKNAEQPHWGKVISELQTFWSHVGDQLGNYRDEVYGSPEYRSLHKANLELFDAIKEIKAGREMTAQELDALNDRRFKAKRALQEKFFGNLSEIKI